MGDAWTQDGLPEKWAIAPIREICAVVRGGSPRPMGDSRYFNGDIPFIKISDVTKSNGLRVYGSETKVNEEGAKKSRLLKKDDLILSNSGTVCVPVFLGVDACIHDGFVAFEGLPDSIDQKYLYHFFKYIRPYIIEKHKQGVTQVNLNTQIVGEISLLLPPTNEQHHIVAKIEALFSELDKGIESLKTAREQLKVYRRAILKHAFEGKLTAQWREENADKLEPSEKLLARIRKEREARYQQQLIDWRAAVKAWEAKGKEGKKPRKPKAMKQVPLASGEELTDLPKLPRGWIWIRPEELAAQEEYAIGIGPFGSNLNVSDYRESGVALIFVRNITRSDFSRELKYIDHEKYLELIAHSVKPLDLLITKMGDPPGDCEIYPESLPEAILTADCLKFRLWEKFADRRFYRNCINSNMVRKQLGLITKGVAQKKISVNRFKTILLPFMCCNEQQVITDYLDKIFSVLGQQEQVIFESLRKAEALRQSILKKAFSGQLVPQDPNDEPASALLERIKEEKAQQKPKTGRKQVKRKAMAG